MRRVLHFAITSSLFHPTVTCWPGEKNESAAVRDESGQSNRRSDPVFNPKPNAGTESKCFSLPYTFGEGRLSRICLVFFGRIRKPSFLTGAESEKAELSTKRVSFSQPRPVTQVFPAALGSRPSFH